MTDKTVTLRLATDAKGVAPGVIQAKGQIDSLGASGQRAGQRIDDGLRKADDQVKRVGQSAGVASTMIARLFAGALGAQGLRTATALADEYTNISGRLKLASNTQAEFTKSQAETFAISQRTSTALESTVALYTRLSKATQEYGVNQQRNLAISETINKTFAISGASADAQKNSITQLTQALAGGVLRAEEFNSIIENSPRLAQALADGMGISMGQLRAHVNDGQVSVERMVQAFESQAAAIQREFEQMPLTVERSLVQLRNSVLLLVGQASTEFGATGALAQGISALASNLGALDQVVGVVAVAIGGRLAASVVKYTAEKLASIAVTRQAALAELESARQAEVAATARLSAARAGLGAAGSLVQAEVAVAAATARTTAATQAASVAATAKAASMRALNSVMAMFGGPVGIAITALTLFVMWLVNSREEARRATKEIQDGFRGAADALKEFNKAPTAEGVGGLSSSLELVKKIKEQVEELTERERDLEGQRMRAVARSFDTSGLVKEQAQLNQELEIAKMRYQELTGATDLAVNNTADMIMKAAGMKTATAAQRTEIESYSRRLLENGVSLDTARSGLEKLMGRLGEAGGAARIAAADFRELQNATKFDWSDVDKGLDKQVNQARVRLIEQEQGKAAAMRAAFAQEMGAAGADITSKEYQERRAKNEELIALQERFEKGQKAATEASRAATKASRDQSKALDQTKDSQARYTTEAALAAAAQQGPLAVAQEQNKQRIAELDKALKAHNITQASYTTLVDASKAALTKRQAELNRDISAPQVLLDAMTGELTVLRQTGLQREISRRQMQVEQDMRRELATAVEAAGGKEQLATKMGAKSYREYETAMLSAADASAVMSVAMEQSARDAEEWAGVWGDAVSSVADAFTDFVMSGLKDFKGLARDLKSISKQLVGDLVRTFLQQKIVVPLQAQITNAVSGGNWMSQLASLFSGGRGMTGTGAMAAQSTWGAALAAGAGSAMGFGNNVGSLAGIAGASGSAGGSAGIGDMVQIGGMLYKAIPAGGISGGMIAAGSYAGGALGALYGWNKGGDTAGKGLGAAAYGAAGYYGATAVGTVAAGYAVAGTAGAAAAGTAALAAIPVAGWIALAAIVVDKISGGKLFGTSYKTKETGQTININEAGGSASAYAYQEGQKSLFRGKKRRTIDLAASDESKEAAGELYQLIQQTAKSASAALGLATVDIVSGSFKAVYDAKGNLKSELATVLGRTYSESFEQFQQRLQAENVIAQVGQLDDMASQIANRWRSSAETLLDGSQFLLAAAADFNTGAGLLTVGGLSRLTDLIEKLREGEETLTQAYQRVMQNAQAYASTAASAYQDVATAGFSNFAKSLLQVKQEEKERIRTLQAQAKALGGLSAREVDLAKVREAAQLKTDALVTGLQGELIDLALNRLNDQIQQLGGSADGAGSKVTDFINSLRMSDSLSVDTDATKRGTASDLMNTAALAGDVDAFINYAQQMLEVSRRLNASGAGYQADYDRVMNMAGQFGGASNLQDLYAQRDALVAQQEAAARLERAQRIAQGVSDLAGVKGGDPLDILRTVTGMSPDALAGDLGLSVSELSKYLENQQTDIGDLADILYELPQRIASEMIIALADKEVPVKAPASTGTGAGTAPGTGGGTGGGTLSDPAVLQELRSISANLSSNNKMLENHLVLK